MYDTLIIGLGGMGSAVAAHAAARGRRVLGYEQFSPAHDRGSSHGKSRIIRQAYFEDPAYVPLVLRAYELWHELERRSGVALYQRTGGLMIGSATSALITGARRSAQEHGLEYEMLEAPDVRRRFPAFRLPDSYAGLLEAPAGMLFPERCVQAHLDWARSAGAELRFETAIAEWGVSSNGAAYALTDAGERLEAETLVLCQGAWLEENGGKAGLPLRIERNVMHWFEPQEHDRSSLAALPIFLIDSGDGNPLYGFPYIAGQGLKAAVHHSGRYTAARLLDRAIAADEVRDFDARLHAWLPTAGRPAAAVACMYTLTPDEHFVIGFHPRWPQVVVCGGFSGHGFKFCSVVGEIVADLLTARATRHPIQLFSPLRFSPAAAR